MGRSELTARDTISHKARRIVGHSLPIVMRFDSFSARRAHRATQIVVTKKTTKSIRDDVKIIGINNEPCLAITYR